MRILADLDPQHCYLYPPSLCPKDADEVAEGVETVDFPEDDNEGEDEGEGDEKMEPDNITLLNPGEEEEGMEGMQVEGEETDQLQIDEGKISSRIVSCLFRKGVPLIQIPLSRKQQQNLCVSKVKDLK
jgi:hypothetical protein